jgi:transcriptional regulator with XRE-family HTH domain
VNKIRELKGSKQMLQRHISAALDVDSAMYCKIERGDCIARCEQVGKLDGLLDAGMEGLFKLWLADKDYEIVGGEDSAGGVLNIVAENIVKYQRTKPL